MKIKSHNSRYYRKIIDNFNYCLKDFKNLKILGSGLKSILTKLFRFLYKPLRKIDLASL